MFTKIRERMLRARTSYRVEVVLPIQNLEPRLMYSTYWVTNTNDSGSGSLRDAINHANAVKGQEVIDFSIGSGVKTIKPLSPLPVLKTPMTIDATTQPGYAGKPLIELDGASAGKTSGIEIVSGGTTVKGLAINRFNGNGIWVVNLGGNTIQGNYIGTDVSGSIKEPNTANGILMGGGGNLVGGTKAIDRNIISGNGNTGLYFLGPTSGNNVVQGNYIGVNAAGNGALGNFNNGLDVQNESGNTIGGTALSAGNVISANGQDGIILFGSADHNTLQGNLIGTDATGTHALGNVQSGIEDQTSYNLIGGTTAAARNVLSGNLGCGVILWGFISTCIDNVVIGNYVGTDITGYKPLGNWGGVVFSNSANDNIAGGTSAVDRNIISGNTHVGVGFYEASDNNLVEGNYVGTDVTGKKAVANREGVGIFNNSIDNIIGGSVAGAGNIISGNTDDGVDVFSNDTTVEGNILGLDGTSNLTPANLEQDLLLIGSSGDTLLKNL